MEPSFIPYETELKALIQRYLNNEISFDELATWVECNEVGWESHEFDSTAEKMALLVMGTLWEKQDGIHTLESVREVIARELPKSSARAPCLRTCAFGAAALASPSPGCR